MNCHTAQDQLLRAADGGLAAEQQAVFNAHVKSCAACRQYADRIDSIPALLQREAESISVPDVDKMWDGIRAKLNTPDEQTTKSRQVVPIIWLTAPLAAAAALLFAFLPQKNHDESSIIAGNDTVQVDYVEIENPDSTAIVYVDQESGWLVVWADDPAGNSS